VRVLFMSGYAGDLILDKGLADGTIDFLAKPVSPEGLLTKVRQVLDRRRPREEARGGEEVTSAG